MEPPRACDGVELRQISSPTGTNLFVIHTIRDGVVSDVIIGTVPFQIILFALMFPSTIFSILRCGGRVR
jgi:TRAP-type C4-dicarboxylate transport system permease large subunit